MTRQSGARAKSNGAAIALLREVAQTGMTLAAIRPTGSETMTADIFSKIATAAQADAVVFVDEFPGDDLGDDLGHSDWDSAAFEMNKDLNAIDGAFEVYRKYLVAAIARLNLQRLHETLTQVSPTDLRSDDLRKEAEDPEYDCECYRSSETVGADAVEIIYWPELDRAGVASGSDSEWTDASSASDALRRYLNDDMSL